MKIYAALCLFFALAHAEYVIKTHENLLQYRTECVDELHIPESLVELYKEWRYPNDELTHCYLKCMFTKFGLFGEEGYNIEYIHQQLAGSNASIDHDDTLHAKIESCIDKNELGSSACEWVYRGATCFMKNNLHLVQQSVAEPHETPSPIEDIY